MSLLAPLYLLGLLGLLLPWLLHRFSHHEPPEQVFPSTRFLEPTTPPATAKRKLRYWPLFGLRVLFLALLCLLFAQPWLRAANDAASSEAVQLLIVDNSFSMRASERWEQAQRALDSVLSELPEQDAVQLFSYASQLTTHTDIVSDHGMINSAVKQIEPGFEAADYGELMRRLNKVAGDINKPVLATFITDAQRTNLPQQMNSLLANRLQKFSVVSVKSDTPINYSLRAEARTSDLITARVSVGVSASDQSIIDNADSLVASKTVQISMQGRLLDSQVVTLNVVNVSFAQSDFLEHDDQVDIPVRGLSSIDIAMTNIGPKPQDQARVFITTALETNGDARVEALDPGAALSPSVRHAVVFIDDLAKVPDAVNRFVSAGGNALLIPSASSSLNDMATSSAASTISRTDLAHALGLGDINWFETSFFSSAKLPVTTDDQVLMSLDSGEPILVERFVGDQGRLLILNDMLDGLNSDLPLQPAFVLLVRRIVEYFNANNALPLELEVGRDLFLPANSHLLTPEGESVLELSQLGSANSVRIEKPGVYTVLGASSTQSVSVVLNSGESNLLALDREELDAWEARHETNATVVETDAQQNDTGNNSLAIDDIQDKLTLWRWLLPIALVILAIESLYANRMLWVRRDGL